ncbi:hypothetical protein SprV_0802647700 [Sparganum proliferum]
MHKDLKAWTRACITCQRSKIQRHNKAPIGTFPGPGARFSHVHLDIVGPLPLSNGCSYLFTCVDRFTRWPEAIPLPDHTAPTVVKAVLSRWVAIFGAPSTITTDRGAQFESNLFQSLLSFLGCTRIQTTAYHPTANGMVERFHRQLKASLRAAADPENWTDHLPLVLLGIHSALKPDLDCSAAELVFGATVRPPGEMISPTPRGAVEDPTNLLYRLRQFMRTLSPVPPRSSASPSYLEKDLTTCSHVYLRCDRVRRPLEPPYDGPFRMLSSGTKTFRIQHDNREEVVSVDRLKAAVPDTPPDEPCGPLPSASPHAASIPPSRILPLPPSRRCISPCSFTSKHSKRVKPVNPKVSAANLPDSSNPGRTFYVCDTATRRRFLVDTGAQISVVPPTAADRRFPSPGLHLQAANCSPIPTFGSLSLTLNIGLRRSLIWIFVIADVPHGILGSDFLAEFDLLVDCLRARLLDRTTGLFVRGLTPFTTPTNLSVLDTDIASPFSATAS